MLPPTVEIAAAGRVGRPPQAVRGERGVEVAVQDAGLDDREQVVGPHLEDAVHARASTGRSRRRPRSRRRRGRCRRRACTTGVPVALRDAQRRLHVGDGCRVHDRQGAAGCRVPRLVGAGIVQRGLRRVDAITERGAQQREDLSGVAHAKRRRPARTPAVTATTAKTRPTQVSPMLHHARVAET